MKPPEQIAKLDEIRKRMHADAETSARLAQQFSQPITEKERAYYIELILAIK